MGVMVAGWHCQVNHYDLYVSALSNALSDVLNIAHILPILHAWDFFFCI